MPQAVDSLTSLVEQLSDRLRDLESRISCLESANLRRASGSLNELLPESKDAFIGSQPSSSAATLPHLQRSRPPATRSGFPPVESSGVFPTIGKAVLGFAGAFLLRAFAESGNVPRFAVLIVAILYACLWMIWSARSSDRFASVTYGIASALILCPMLWEATVRFQAMSPTASAAVLVGFIILTLILASRRELQLVSWIAIFAAVITAIALIIGTRELLPLTAALLGVAAVTELSACLGHNLSLRVVPAIFADFSIWLLIYILGSDSVPEGYRAASPATLIALGAFLPAVYAASIGVRIFIQLRRITFFEIAQAAASVALAAFGVMTVTRNAAAPALGLVFLLLAAISYWGTLSRFAADAHRNRRVTATWAAALLLAGTFLVVPREFQTLFLCVAALLAAIVYTRTGKLSLGLHTSLYLASAAAVSPLAVYVWSSLAGTIPGAPQWGAWTVAFASALCYAVESSCSEDEGRRRLLWVVPAGVVAFTIAAWGVSAVIRLSAGHIALAASHLAMIRTIVICILALTLGLASRHRHIELRWIAYAAVALGTLKLLLEDLRFGNPASLVVSFVFYGLILIILPRLTRSNETERASGS